MSSDDHPKITSINKPDRAADAKNNRLTQSAATEQKVSKKVTAKNTDSERAKAGKQLADKGESNLLKFDDTSSSNNISSTGASSTGKDINIKITALDTDLEHLRAELSAINNSVEEGLDRLSDTDTDLTAKVSETYKRLGEIDNAYKSLLEISCRIDIDIQKLNGDVSTVAEVSANGIKTLEQSTIAQSTEFAHKNQQVVSRVNQLVETSKMTGELLSQKVQLTTDKIMQVEQKVVSEIQNLASATDEKTNTLVDSVNSNKAKILKLQSVDEAIIKRATTLEISSAELSVKSQELMSATDSLEQSTKDLSSDLSELQEKTRILEATSNSHGSLIKSLQSASYMVSQNIAALSKRENNRFGFVVGSFVLLVLASVALFFMQNEKFEDIGNLYAQSNSAVETQFTGLQQDQLKAVTNANDALIELENKVIAIHADMKSSMQQELDKERVLADGKIQKIQDQVQSVEGRFNNDSSFSQIANDNIIHGEQWISAQDGENYTLQVAYVKDRQLMFELAQSYNSDLKDSLSYFKVNNNGDMKYVLLSGSYADQRQAMAKLKTLPDYIDMKRPVIRKFADVKKYIGQKI